MNNCNKDVFTRMDLGQIQAFVLHGTEALEAKNQDYSKSLQDGREAIYRRLQLLCQDEDSLDEAHGDLSQALGCYESVFMEIGMKAGARIVCQLLQADSG